MKQEKTVEIHNCVGKEIMKVKRFGGDLVLRFVEASTGKVVFETWFELKKPAKKNFEKVIAQFEEVKKRLVT